MLYSHYVWLWFVRKELNFQNIISNKQVKTVFKWGIKPAQNLSKRIIIREILYTHVR